MESGYTYKLEDYLNKRGSLRNLLKELVDESNIKIDTEEKDWKKIKKF
jgi:hypothetical protein